MSEIALNPSLLRFRGVTRWFGDQCVLRYVDLDVPAGSVTAILGRNGAGKSTLLQIASGQLARHTGEIEVLGCDPEDFGPRELERLGVVGLPLGDKMSRVRDVIRFVRRVRSPR